jgi:hypothetical protein
VRVHADPTAATLARGLQARAFTVGTDVAFAPGEWQPGSLVGDAVLAHELAHVVQQSSWTLGGQVSGSVHESLEDDADRAAAGAVASGWGASVETVIPRLRSGLSLQRCATTPTRAAPPGTARPGGIPQDMQGVPVVDTDPGDTGMGGTEQGFANCNPATGKMEVGVLRSTPECVRPCVAAHEQAHVQFSADQCREIGRRAQEADRARAASEAALAAAKANPSAMNAAEKAAADAETANDATSHARQAYIDACWENEKKAYRAGSAVCASGQIIDWCNSLGQSRARQDVLSSSVAVQTVEPPNCVQAHTNGPRPADWGRQPAPPGAQPGAQPPPAAPGRKP